MTITHRIFVITILAKGLLGLIQLMTAAALYFGVLEHLPRIAQWLVARELSEDPNDFIATQILSLANIAPTSDSTFYTVYFAAHGFLHVAVVTMLLSGARWANHVAISVLSLFVIYQLFEWFAVGGKTLLVLTVVDLAVIYLTARERRKN
jgi:uncharacterized membrane protein